MACTIRITSCNAGGLTGAETGEDTLCVVGDYVTLEVAAKNSGQPLTRWNILGEMPRFCPQEPQTLLNDIICRFVKWTISPEFKFGLKAVPFTSFDASLGSAEITNDQEVIGRRGERHRLVKLIRGSHGYVAGGALPLSLKRDLGATLLCQEGNNARACSIDEHPVHATTPIKNGIKGLEVTLAASLTFSILDYSMERNLNRCFITASRMPYRIRFRKKVVITPDHQA